MPRALRLASLPASGTQLRTCAFGADGGGAKRQILARAIAATGLPKTASSISATISTMSRRACATRSISSASARDPARPAAWPRPAPRRSAIITGIRLINHLKHALARTTTQIGIHDDRPQPICTLQDRALPGRSSSPRRSAPSTTMPSASHCRCCSSTICGNRTGVNATACSTHCSAGLLILPFFLFSAIAGQLADKFDKALLARRDQIRRNRRRWPWRRCRSVTDQRLAAAPRAVFLTGSSRAFFGPIKYSILPQHLERA